MTTSDPPRRQIEAISDADRKPVGSSVEPTNWPPGLRSRPLYGAFYGLRELPFDLTPNPRFLFLSRPQTEALSNLRYALASSKGFALILGDAGTGKTTIVRTALDEISEGMSRYVLVNNPTLERAEFYDLLAREFGLSAEARRSKPQFLTELRRDVEARLALGGLTGLVIDEAQSLPHELLEEIRLLGNIETTTTKLLNIVLSGQPELAQRLNDPSLRQLKQRIALRCELKPLNLNETASYISGRLRIAGGAPADVFTRETVVALHAASRGIPRTINVLCENALINGFAAQLKPVPVGVVREVCRDFDVASESHEPQPAAPSPPQTDRRPNDAFATEQGATEPRAAGPSMFSSIEKPRRFRFF